MAAATKGLRGFVAGSWIDRPRGRRALEVLGFIGSPFLKGGLNDDRLGRKLKRARWRQEKQERLGAIKLPSRRPQRAWVRAEEDKGVVSVRRRGLRSGLGHIGLQVREQQVHRVSGHQVAQMINKR
jgi:hypothetical protein